MQKEKCGYSDNDDLKKLATGVKGLDDLFYGGIQLGPETLSGKDAEDGLVIIIRGERGCHKTLLAMQLMYGLTRSYRKDRGNEKGHSPQFYSLNKSSSDLSNMYLQFLITQYIDKMIETQIQMTDPEEREEGNEEKDCLKNIIANLFETHNIREKNGLPKDLKKNIAQYLCTRTVYYNVRTNALHFQQVQGDDRTNRLCNLKRNPLNSFQEIGHEDFIFVDFTGKEDSSEAKDNKRYHYSTTTGIRFHDLVDRLQSSTQRESGERPNRIPCVVFDGFSQMSTEELKTIAFSYAEKKLRESARISILVFDDRVEEIKCNADIIIEMHRKKDPVENYTSHELQITKSVFQTVAFGWHQYKKRDSGVEVFPSLHRLLQKRNYLPHALLSTHSGILEESFGQYLNNQVWENRNRSNVKQSDYSYNSYETRRFSREMALLREMHSGHFSTTKEKDEKKRGVEKLKQVLFNLSTDRCPRWKEHEYSTALIGNPNSYKRYLAMASAFSAAKRKEHTLIILFDKEASDMRRQMICPGLQPEWTAPSGKQTPTIPCGGRGDCLGKECPLTCYPGCPNRKSCGDELVCRETRYRHDNCKLMRECHECYRYIHFFGIRMGCISAEEFFAVLKQQIEVPFRESGGDTISKFKHIIIDDLQKIDYCFPFLKHTPLFLTAMIAFCRDLHIELKILCDKHAQLARELCSLADNVLCVRRSEKDADNMTLYLERMADHVAPSEIFRFEINQVGDLFRCDKDVFDLGEKADLEVKRIGSMKEYWRNTINVIHRQIDNREED